MNQTQDAVSARVAELANLKMSDLWTLWDKYFPRRPDFTNRAHVQSRIAYEIQKEAYGGGLAVETRRKGSPNPILTASGVASYEKRVDGWASHGLGCSATCRDVFFVAGSGDVSAAASRGQAGRGAVQVDVLRHGAGGAARIGLALLAGMRPMRRWSAT
jgi:hypothetical protein